MKHHAIHLVGSALVFALVVLLFVPLSASADVTMVQKSYTSNKYARKEPIVSSSIIRTRIAEGRLRQEYGDPASFIHITRLDRRPGELISYLINLNRAPRGNTYWTFCRPHVWPLPKTHRGEVDKTGSDATNIEPDSSPGHHEGLTVTDTGEMKRINNLNCRKYLLKGRLGSTELTSEVWVTMDIVPTLDRYGLIWGIRLERSDSELWFREGSADIVEYMRAVKGFPVLITEIEHNEYVRYERKLELLEFNEEPAASSQFDLPEGLTKKYLGAMAKPPVCED